MASSPVISIKNVSDSDQIYAGISVLSSITSSGEAYVLAESDFIWLSLDRTFLEALVSGQVVVNDGTNDVSPAVGLRLIRRQIFDNATNGFLATNISDAIYEQVSANVPGANFSIVAETTRVHPNLGVSDGTEVDVEDDGELIIL